MYKKGLRILALIYTLYTPLLQSYNPEDVALAVLYNSDHHTGRSDRDKVKQPLDAITDEIVASFPNAQHLVVRNGDHIDGIESTGAKRAFLGAKLAKLLTCSAQSTVQEQSQAYLGNLASFEEEHPTILIPGNHDFYDAERQIPQEIKNRYGDLRYVHKINLPPKSLYVISCGVWPDEATCAWLSERLEQAGTSPVILAMHYDMFKGDDQNRRWVTQEDIQRFANTIEPYKNIIQEITAGHTHETYTTTWHDIFCSCAGGKKLVVSLYDGNGARVETKGYESESSDGNYHAIETEIGELATEPEACTFCGLQRWWNNKVVNQWYTK